jgi:hypothetical protein
MAYQGAICSKISAEFLNYTDPRLAFDIVQKKDHSAMEFVQNGQLVAIVYITANVPVPLREAEMKQKFSLS